MQAYHQGTGAPGFPQWTGIQNSYARYKNASSIRYFNQPTLKTKNVVPIESEYKRRFNESPTRSNGPSSLNASIDYSSPSSVSFQQSSYGRGKGLRNLEYGRGKYEALPLQSKEWKQGSLLRTSSEHRISYLSDNDTLFPEIKRNIDRNNSTIKYGSSGHNDYSSEGVQNMKQRYGAHLGSNSGIQITPKKPSSEILNRSLASTGPASPHVSISK
jgi:hypothetical protein